MAAAAAAVAALLIFVSGSILLGEKDESFGITTTETSLGVGQEKYLVSGMARIYVLEGMEWTSSDESVVSVTADPEWAGGAFIKGMSVGDAAVTASYGGSTSTVEVHVTAGSVGNELKVYNMYSPDRDYALLSGSGFESGVLSLAFNYGGTAAVTLSGYTPEMLSESEFCTGNAYADLSSVAMTLTDTGSMTPVASGIYRPLAGETGAAVLAADGLTVGHTYGVSFTVTLRSDPSAVYTVGGTFEYVGNDGSVDGTNLFKRPYAWRYGGNEFSFEIEFPYGLYHRYHQQNGDYVTADGGFYRNSSAADFNEAFFCRSNQVTRDISDNLRAEYLRVYGPEAPLDGQAYAEFVLAFVQVSWYYSLDNYQYISEGADYAVDYWTFPMETIYSGSGDCEDTAILCAVLFDEAGYPAGVYDIPEHAVAAVHVAEYSGDIRPGFDYMAYSIAGGDGKLYYGCETTMEYPSGIGAVPSSLINDELGVRHEEIKLYLL